MFRIVKMAEGQHLPIFYLHFNLKVFNFHLLIAYCPFYVFLELAGRQLTQEQLAEYLKVQQHESEEEDKLLTVMRRLLSRVERLHYEYINSVDSSPYQMLKQEVIRIIADYENVSDHMLEILQVQKGH